MLFYISIILLYILSLLLSCFSICKLLLHRNIFGEGSIKSYLLS